MEGNLNENIITSENIIKIFKKAVKLVVVNLDGKEANIPVYYNVNAFITYQDAFEETKDYRQAFCMMVYEMVEDNRKTIHKENDLTILTLDDIKGLSNEDLQKICEKIIHSSHYLKEIESELEVAEYEFLKKFYLINKKEKEKYSGQMKKIAEQLKSVKPKLDVMNSHKNLFQSLELVRKMSKVSQVTRPVSMNLAIAQQQIV